MIFNIIETFLIFKYKKEKQLYIFAILIYLIF